MKLNCLVVSDISSPKMRLIIGLLKYIQNAEQTNNTFNRYKQIVSNYLKPPSLIIGITSSKEGNEPESLIFNYKQKYPTDVWLSESESDCWDRFKSAIKLYEVNHVFHS